MPRPRTILATCRSRSELAAIGFLRFNAAMREADGLGGTPAEKAMARARAYVAYALANPAMYGLMFRTERLDMTRPALRDAADASFSGLAGPDRRPAASSRSTTTR